MTEKENIPVKDMKHGLCRAFYREIGKNAGMANVGKRRKLVLHFDVNKTIVPVDSATGETVEDALNVYLSGMAWGLDKEGTWESSMMELSSKPQVGGEVSFYKFEEKRLLQQISENRSVFRNHLTSFTDKPQGSNFKPFHTFLLQKLKWNLPYDENVHKHLTVPGSKECRFHFILPSFFVLLNRLVEEERDFTVVFRTFGKDATSVLKCIKAAIDTDMPFCQNLKCMSQNISENVLVLKRIENGLLQLIPDGNSNSNPHENELHATNGVPKCLTDEQMYARLTNTSGICAIQDDVKYWYENNFHPSKGKPFWINNEDPDTQHIFFDDNIRPGMLDSIVNIRLRNPTELYEDVERAEERKFVNTNIVPVCFSEAILNENYFVDKVLLCEENFTRLLENVT